MSTKQPVPVVNRRKANSRKQWYTISIAQINGVTREVAKFRCAGDAALWLQDLAGRPDLITAIYID